MKAPPIVTARRSRSYVELFMTVGDSWARLRMVKHGEVRWSIKSSDEGIRKALETYLERNKHGLFLAFIDEFYLDDFKKELYAYLKVML